MGKVLLNGTHPVHQALAPSGPGAELRARVPQSNSLCKSVAAGRPAPPGQDASEAGSQTIVPYRVQLIV
jgi:hypothetical protein